MSKAIGNFAALLFVCCSVLHAQIWDGGWFSSTGAGFGTSCTDDRVDAEAICEVHAYCTEPPDPIPGFVIAGAANNTCPNQPVDNYVTIGQTNSITEHVYAHSTALGFDHRTIFTEVREGDCNGRNELISTYYDPYGCNPPPPPPPPPVCTPTGSPAQPTGSMYQAWDTNSCGWVWVPCPNGVCGNSPIVIDPAGEGFHLTSVTSGVRFDISGSGQPVQIAWTAPGSKDGFLALDRNNNGAIDDGKELFGNFTDQPASSTPNGYLALAEFDKAENGGNGDGIIDSRDDVFSKLRLWIDANHDGISQPDELFALPSLGIYSLGLRYRSSPRVDQYGNQFRYTSIVNPRGRRDQVSRRDYDVFLVAGAPSAAATLLPDKLTF